MKTVKIFLFYNSNAKSALTLKEGWDNEWYGEVNYPGKKGYTNIDLMKGSKHRVWVDGKVINSHNVDNKIFSKIVSNKY